jgi:alginate O-acetyltransferase complex protein AlgI
MLFHTWVFAVFFLIVYPVYLLVRKNNSLMNFWLMIASYAFYGWWNPLYLVLLFGSSAIDYLMVLFMERSQTRRTRKIWLVISLVSNFGLLGVFKYAGFIVDNVNALLTAVHAPYAVPRPDILLPIGISFHTFQSMSYTIDAYYRKIQTERSFVRFLTFVSFFPQLVAGPIERASNLLPQLQGTPVITRRDLVDGLSLFLVGFFKKVAMADYLSIYVDRIYAHPEQFQSSHLILATFAFAWQIYFDFSGYTDMARGIAYFMGFRLMLNFNNPYVATGLGDFWNRWHISLSTWFKDYVYFPLGGNRGSKWFTYRNMVATMLISGVWHGAAWGYVIWGALHAVGRVVTRELEQTAFYRDRIPKIVKQLGVFVFVGFTWIFFRGQTWGQSWLVLSRMFTTGWVNPQFPTAALALIFAIWIYQFLYTSQGQGKSFVEWAPVRVGLALAMLVYLAVVAQPGSQQFIYFQF